MSQTQRLEMSASQYPLVGSSKVMDGIRAQIEQAGRASCNVLITGPTGSGKEVVARNIHSHKGQGSRFVPINCTALPAELIESELFGHERGAFTGALQTKPGLFETANGGTLFLDEIIDLPLSQQGKLLRILQDKTVRRIGSNNEIIVDFRLIAATNGNMVRAVKNGKFREDLYYRLKGFTIRMPPLVEHASDIPELVNHFLTVFDARNGRESKTQISDDTITVLCERVWPGNVRELENLLEAAIARADDQALLKRKDFELEEDLPGENFLGDLSDLSLAECVRFGKAILDKNGFVDGNILITKLMQGYLLAASQLCKGNIQQTANKTGLARQTVYRYLRGIDQEELMLLRGK